MAAPFELLIERYHDEILGYLWRLLGVDGREDRAADAEDLAQEVFLRAYRAYPKLRPSSNHRAWLYKIATNCACTRLRQRKKRRDRYAPFEEAETAGWTEDENEGRKSLRRLVERLPVKQKACLTLRYLQELDYRQIARILGCTEQNARANVSRAIRSLRSALEK
ncbi:MAG TPA: RNA polymerase sigma factor [candidate division Zixibacteria bacterium]|nr:RNA polymerase sigma factor [candidate division Zixibacteria bacterium]